MYLLYIHICTAYIQIDIQYFISNQEILVYPQGIHSHPPTGWLYWAVLMQPTVPICASAADIPVTECHAVRTNLRQKP